MQLKAMYVCNCCVFLIGGRAGHIFCIGEGPKYRPFHDLRSMPEPGRPMEQVETHGRACTQVLFLQKAELGFFHFLKIVTGCLVPSAGQKIPTASIESLIVG
jgi:hypothetical protein